MIHKSPCFQFYPDDFMGGQPGTMDPLETHVYIWLLCRDWNDDGFVFDGKRLATWCHVTPKQFAQAWKAVGACFEERDGRYYNPRLDKERAKQEAYRARQAANGARGGRPKNPPETHQEPTGNPRVSSGFLPGNPQQSSPVPCSLFPNSSPSSPADSTGTGWMVDPVDTFLALITADVQRATWTRQVAAWLNGMDLPAGVTAIDVRVGLTEYLASVPDPTFSVAHVRGFVIAAHRQRTRPARRPASEAQSMVDYFLNGPANEPTEAA